MSLSSTPDQVTIIIMCLLFILFWLYSDLIKNVFNTGKNAGTFAYRLRFLVLRQKFSVSDSMLEIIFT